MSGKCWILCGGDGALRVREMQGMRKLDRAARLERIDIRLQPEQLAAGGWAAAAALAGIHARDEWGRLRSGVGALLGMYACIGLARMVAALSWSPLKGLLKVVYPWFARCRPFWPACLLPKA
ncbi:DCC1-like thiol-disulfide oxidoreductase family protein [Chromobacterium violaceum]|uniref:DCC1-like thiol-disulfide oxidoreductase family protein n=1 Tax=Chromobacterium violaceum TaxID=536 RepID=UPI003DA7BE50